MAKDISRKELIADIKKAIRLGNTFLAGIGWYSIEESEKQLEALEKKYTILYPDNDKKPKKTF